MDKRCRRYPRSMCLKAKRWQGRSHTEPATKVWWHGSGASLKSYGKQSCKEITTPQRPSDYGSIRTRGKRQEKCRHKSRKSHMQRCVQTVLDHCQYRSMEARCYCCTEFVPQKWDEREQRSTSFGAGCSGDKWRLRINGTRWPCSRQKGVWFLEVVSSGSFLQMFTSRSLALPSASPFISQLSLRSTLKAYS